MGEATSLVGEAAWSSVVQSLLQSSYISCRGGHVLVGRGAVSPIGEATSPAGEAASLVGEATSIAGAAIAVG